METQRKTKSIEKVIEGQNIFSGQTTSPILPPGAALLLEPLLAAFALPLRRPVLL